MPALNLASAGKLPLLTAALFFFVLAPLFLEWAEVIEPDSYAAGATHIIDWGRTTLGGANAASSSRWRSRPVGSLHELVRLAMPLWDTRTTVDMLKLSSSRVLPNSNAQALFTGAGDKREHILVTGGYGSLGKHVVRDLLLLGRDTATVADEDEWSMTNEGDERAHRDTGVVVTLLDTADRHDELEFILGHLPRFHRSRLLGPLQSEGVGFDVVDPRSAAFAGREISIGTFVQEGRLRIAKADVRNVTAMQQILQPDRYGEYDFTATRQKQANHRTSRESDRPPPPVSGIVHLAGYAESKCAINPRDCRSVEIEGARTLAAILGETQVERRPWLVSARGPAEVSLRDYAAPMNGSTPDIEDLNRRPGKRKRQLETASQTHLALHSLASSSRMNAISLRLPPDSHLLGDPFASRRLPLPYLVQNALGHLPIHVHADSFPTFARPRAEDEWIGLSIMSIEDIVEAILSAAELLSRAQKAEYLERVSLVTEVDIVPPTADANLAEDTVDFVLQLTRSESPVAYETFDLPLRRRPSPLSPRTANRLLRLRSPEPSTIFLRSYLSSILSLQGSHLEKLASQSCAQPPPLSELEAAMLGADGCFVQLIAIVDGMSWSFACSQDLDEFSQPLAMLNAVPHAEGVRGIRIGVERSATGEGSGIELAISCPTGAGGADEAVAWLSDPEGQNDGFVTASQEPKAIHKRFHVDFVRRDTKAFSLSLPLEGDGWPKRKLMVRDVGGVDSKIAYFPDSGESASLSDLVLELRVNEICCGSKEGKGRSFLREDPLYTSQIIYPSVDGFTTLSDSTLAVQQCRDHRQSQEYTKKLKTWLESTRSAEICPRIRGEGADWVAHDLPLCTIDCSAPLPCLITERCRCPHDRCADRGAAALGPFPSVAHTDEVSFQSDSEASVHLFSLSERIERLPWSSIVLPHAWRAFSLPVDSLPIPYVVPVPESVDNHLTQPACYSLEAAPVPFSSDHVIIEALRERSQPLNSSDFAVVPYYQGCYFNYVNENTYKKLADTVAFAETQIPLSETTLASNIVVPFTHDWGSCTGWWSRHEEVLSRNPPPPMNKATSWQVNGDFSTRCIKAERDIVIPARSRNTPALVSTYRDLALVMSVHDRKHLAFFAGGMRGFGALARTRLGCGRAFGDPEAETLYQAYASGSNYIETLNQAKFCLLPRGIPAWSTRTFEAIYAGCIPVFIADRNYYPFDDILDYSTFSLTIPENEVDTVDAVLRAVPNDALERYQVAVLKVREAFVYAEGQGEEWLRRGPVVHALVSMAMRLSLSWPFTDSC